jgi:predicted GH43/DUF377 family glycosyl hydrolase
MTIAASGAISSGSASGEFVWSVRETTGSLTEAMSLDPSGDLYLPLLSNDEAETNVIGYDTATGLLSYMSVPSGGFGGETYWDRSSAGVLSTDTPGDNVLLEGDLYFDTEAGTSSAGYLSKYIYWGEAGDWDTYIYESSDDNLELYVGGNALLKFANNSIEVYKASYVENDIYFDNNSGVSFVSRTIYWGDSGDWDTYIYESTDDVLQFYLGASQLLQLSSTTLDIYGAINLHDITTSWNAYVNSQQAAYYHYVYGLGAYGTTYWYHHHGGSQGSSTLTPANADILKERFYAHDGTTTIEVARRETEVSGTPAAGSASGIWKWYVRETTGSLTEAMTLNPDGSLDLPLLANDEAETNVVGYDTATGLLTYMSVPSGGLGGGETYWDRSSAGLITTDTAGDDLAIDATSLFYLDGGTDTYIHEESANLIQVVCNDIAIMDIEEDNVSVNGPVSALAFDGAASSVGYMMAYNGTDAGGSNYRIGISYSRDGYNYYKSANNPIISPVAATWEHDNVKDAALLKVHGIYYIYYTGFGSTDQNQIGLATSSDGVNWTKYSGNPVVTFSDTNNIHRFPTVYYDENEATASKVWKMWYVDANWDIGYAYSADGYSWTKYGSNPVLSRGSGGSWDDANVLPGPVHYKDGTWYLYYGGRDGTWWQIGLATFTDPESTYTKDGSNPIIARRSSAGADLTANLTTGNKVVTIADTSIFEVDEYVWMHDTTVSTQLNRIFSIDSSTQLTLRDAATDDFTTALSAKIRSLYYGSLSPSSIYHDGKEYVLSISAFQILNDLGVTAREHCAVATSTALDSGWGIDFDKGLILQMGNSTDWDEYSAENPSLIPAADDELLNLVSGLTVKEGVPILPSFTTTQRDNIATDVNGMLLYNTTTNTVQAYENSAWVSLSSGGGISWDNGASNRVGTYVDADSINAEANLTFDGSTLTVAGEGQINHVVHGTNALEIDYVGPSVASDATNNDFGFYIDMRLDYDIANTKTDSGSRMGFISAVHIMDTDFLGTLSNQYGALIQYGQHTDAGAGTVTTAYGLRLQYFDLGSATITTKYSIYSGESDPMMYHAGNVGIGVSPSSSYELYVAGADVAVRFESTTGNALFELYGNDSGDDSSIKLDYAGGSSGAEILWQGSSGDSLFIKNSGNTGLEITTAGYPYMVNMRNAAGANYVYWNSGGELTYNTTSDIRLKENIRVWAPDSLLFLRDLDLITYDRKDGSQTNALGWNGTLMEELMPDMTWRDEKDYVNIKDAHFPYHFHRAIQQLGDTQETQAEKIIRLEKRVAELEAQIN